MSQSLEDFLSSSDSLLAHLRYEKESQLYFSDGLIKYSGDTDFEVEFKKFVSEVVENSFLRSKVYSYKNAIISLYGCLEKFIEDSIIEYLKNIYKLCPDHDLLPASIKKNHLGLSLDLINKIQKIKGFSDEEKKVKLSEALNNMNSFFKEGSSFDINYDAFSNHSSNFRYDTIHEVFLRVGIDKISKECLRDVEFTSPLCQKHTIESSSEQKLLVSILMTELDDLTQRRNEIAHGVIIEDIESIDIIISRINLIKEYVKSIYRVVKSHLDIYRFSVSPNLHLGKPARIFENLNVIGFQEIKLLENSNIEPKISKGDILFAVNNNSSNKNISGEIISLRIDNVVQEEVALPCDKSVSICVNFDISNNFNKRSIYVIPHTT